MEYSADDIRLSDAFAAVLRKWLAAAEFAEVRRLNSADPAHADNSVCHSHDYCDANMAMVEAFRAIHGRELFGDDGMAYADCDTVNRAWACAGGKHLSATAEG